MTEALLLSLALVLCAFTLTRKTYVKIRKDDAWRVELHFTLSAIRFERTVAKSDTPEEKKKKGRTPPSYYREVVHRLTELFEVAELEIRRLFLPVGEGADLYGRRVTAPWRYHTAVSALIAYLDAKSEKLTIHDNAIILNPDDGRFSLDVTIKVRLFYILRTYLALRREKERLKRKGYANVGK